MGVFWKKNVNDNLKAVVTGRIIPIENVEDEVFSSGMMGVGMAIEPAENIIYAPGNGRVISANLEMGHAIGLKMDSGIEVLIHIGIDTVKLPANTFSVKVKENQKVKAGTKLIEFDRDAIARNNYKDTVIVVLTDTNGHKVDVIASGDVKAYSDDIVIVS